MLKRILAVSAVLGALAAPLSAQAAKPQSDEVTITGTVIDLNCYVAGGAMGASHKGCAEACAKAGVQLGITMPLGVYTTPKRLVGLAAVVRSADRAGTMLSSSGSASAVPRPRSTVRRGIAFLVTIMNRTSASGTVRS